MTAPMLPCPLPQRHLHPPRPELRIGDVITAVDGRPVTDQTDVVVAIRSHLVTDKVKLTVLRDGRTLEFEVGLLAKTG